MQFNLKKNLPHIVAVVTILLFNVIYFMPQFQGMKLQMGDIVSNQGMGQEARQFKEKTGEDTYWTNSMFGGMPTYTISSPHKYNWARTVERGLGFYLSRPAGIFIMGMLSCYIALFLFGVNSWVALIISIVFGISTGNLMLMGAGHVTKVRTILASLPIIVGVVMVMKDRLWSGLALFGLFMSISLGANHPQMTYYLGMMLAIYMLIELIVAIKRRDIVGYLKKAVLLGVVSLLALGTSASKLLPSYEYAKYTMRGDPILKSDGTTAKSSSETKGLDWDYAMSWSGGFLDIVSTFIPRAAGGATVEPISSDSKFAKLTGQRNANVPIYFGALPSTGGPYYFGAIIFFLFVLGCFIVKGRLRWWLIAALITTFLMSMGKNFEVLNRLFFDYFPLFNKFRTPNSVFSISGLLLIFLAALSLDRVVKVEDKSSLIKPVLYSFGIVGGFSILFGLIGPSFLSFDSAYDARMGVDGQILDALKSDRGSMLRSSAFRTLFFVFVAAGLVYAFLKNKISKIVMLALLGVFAIVDQALVSKNYFGKDNFVKGSTYRNNFAQRPVDTQILKDTDPHFRVQDFTINTYNSSIPSYYHKTIGGYSPAKLQRINDVIERHLGNRSQQNPYGNQKVLNMLNTKYFIVPGQNNTAMAQRNPSAAGNAWFVEDIRYVNSANEEIDALNTIEPLREAVIHSEFKDDLAGFDPQKSGDIKLTSYAPDRLVYSSNAPSEQLAVFSEIWYRPGKGWKSYVDGNEVSHIRANYLLRAMRVPAGQHEIVFEFEPDVVKTGSTISLISSVLMLGLLGFVVFQSVRNSDNLNEKNKDNE